MTSQFLESPAARQVDHLLGDSWYRRLLFTSSVLQDEVHRFFAARGLGALAVPTTTGSVSSPMGLGSDSLPVLARINGKDLYLADSQQFLLELGLRMQGRGVYYVSCSFRGEAVDESHLSEFTHAEAEIAGGLEDVIDLSSALVDALFQRSLAEQSSVFAGDERQQRVVEALAALRGRYPQVRFDQVYREYQARPGFFKELLPGVMTITRSGEQQLMRDMGGITWLTHLPQLACPFYQQRETGTDGCLSADLLFGVGEILGSGERSRDHAELLESLAAHKVDPTLYDWYVRMKEIAPLRTAGFGLGLERFLMGLLGCPDIRRCTPWLRGHGSVVGP